MKTLKNLTKRAAATVLALVMCLGLLNVTAFAADNTGLSGCCNAEIMEKGGKYICSNCGHEVEPEETKPEETKPEETKPEDKKDGFCTDGNHVLGKDGKCLFCPYVEPAGSDPVTPVDPSKPGYHPVGPFHTKEDCYNSVETWLHDDDTDEHYAHCSVRGTDCPRWENDFEIREDCYYEKNSDGIEECKVCHYKKSPVELTPGGGPECADGNHNWGNTAQSVDPAHHALRCIDCGKLEASVPCEFVYLYGDDGKQLIAHYCPLCHNNISIVDADKDQYCGDIKNGHKWGKATEELSPNGHDVLTTLVCENCGAKKITNVCTSPAQVTVHYVYADGKQAVPDATQPVFTGSSYELKSPEIPGYTPDLEVVEGICKDGKGGEFTVTYTKIDTYTLTIHYQKPGGEQVYEDVVLDKLKEGDEYSVKTPSLEGYDVEQEVVEGKMPGHDEVITVKYEPHKYTWTIYHLYRDGEGKEVEVKAPEVFTFTVENISALTDREVGAVGEYVPGTTTVKAPEIKPLENKKDVVYYTLKTYTLTVSFVDGEGNALADPVIMDGLHRGDKRTPVAAVIEGWTTSTEASEITMGSEDRSFVFVYTRNTTTPPPEENDPTPTPTPNPPQEEVEEPDVPLMPEPNTEIDEPDVPLAPDPDIEIDEPDVPLAPEPEPETEIDEPSVPLADVPQTGDSSQIWSVLTVASAAGLVWLTLEDRKRKGSAK